MANHRRNAQQRHFASTELSRLAKVKRRRNAVPSTKEAQRELAAQAAAEHAIQRIPEAPRDARRP